MAVVLNLSLASIFDAAGYPMHRDLPQLVPYLRERYPELPEGAVMEMERYLEDRQSPRPGRAARMNREYNRPTLERSATKGGNEN